MEPTRVHFVKEISRKIDLAHTSVMKHIETLLDLKLITKVQSEIYKGYKANREDPDFIFYKKIDNLIFLKESGLIEVLKEKFPKSIILFGSYNKGEDIESSDIDIFIDSKAHKIECQKFEKILNRKIHIIFEEEASRGLKESINQGTILFGER